MSKYIIRKVDIEDIDFIYYQDKLVFKEDPWGDKDCYKDIVLSDVSYFYIVLDGDIKIGYIGITMSEPFAEVISVLVVDEYRKKGIASMMFDKVFKVCLKKGVKQLTLEVRPSNKNAIKLYNKLGFEVAYIRKNYYKDEDGIVYIKNLGD